MEQPPADLYSSSRPPATGIPPGRLYSDAQITRVPDEALIRALIVIVIGGSVALGAAGGAAAPSSAAAGTVTPESVGISTERASAAFMPACRRSRTVTKSADTSTLVAREGKVVDLHASGFQDVESRTPMKTDTIFRVASMIQTDHEASP